MRGTTHRFASSQRAVARLVCILSLSSGFSLFAQSPSGAGGDSIVLDSHATIVVGPDQPGPVLLAAKDLASDMQKVFGGTPRIVRDGNNLGPVAIVIGDDLSGAPADHSTAPEAFSITSGESSSSGSQAAGSYAAGPHAAAPHATKLIRLSGADMRGTLYAIYQFSQQYLGVDPMYYWTDHQPLHRASIRLSASLHDAYAAPVFRYRGFFINDEDLLTGWAPGEAKDHTGISLDVWNKICETVLRLKGNMIVAGTWPFPGEPQDTVVMQRGLLLNQHHAEPLGVNFSRWPKGVPYNLTSDPQYIENAWKNAVASYKPDQQILWEIGLRGLSDEPYSALDPAVRGNDHAQGHIISKALADQVRLVRARYPDAVFITDLWMEGARLMRQGDLVIPKGVTTVWADTGYGDMQDDGQVGAGQGAYIHVAMYNGVANQLSELTPVDRLFGSLDRFQKAGATAFLLVNTSDIRPVTMGASAVLDFGWKGSNLGSSDDFYTQWSSEEFGPRAASRIAQVYKAYFAAPALLHGAANRPYGDNYYHTVARELIRRVMVQWPTYNLPGQAPEWTEPRIHDDPYDPTWPQTRAQEEIAACGQAQPRWDAVWKQAEAAQPLVAPDRRLFYQAGVLTMITINRESNRMLLSLSRAIVALHNGDHATAVAQTNDALQAIDAIKASEARAEYGKWKNWYGGDWLTGVDRTHQLLLAFAAYLKNPNVPVPLPVELNNWEAYYHIQHYEGQRTVDVK